MVVLEQDTKQKEMIRFIDYFFMCGQSDEKDAKLYKLHEEDTSASPTKLESSVLCHFPKNHEDNPWNPAELWKLCTPLGLAIDIGVRSPTTRPRFHSFLITREDGSKTHGHVLTFYELCVNPLKKKEIAEIVGLHQLNPEENIYVEKCIGFITQLPLINTCEKVLRSLFKLFMENYSSNAGINLPIESYIYNLLYEVPLGLLSPGGSLKLSCMGHTDPVIVHLPPMSDLPILDVNLSEVIRLLGGSKNLMNLLTSVLYERQILFVSEDSRKLGVVAEGITALLFPFQWQHTHVSVLPYTLACHFFDAPVPYLIGVVVTPDQKQHVRQALEVNQCYVDLDNAIVESPEDQPYFPNHRDIVYQLDSFIGIYKNDLKTILKGDLFPSKPNGTIPSTEPDSGHNTNDALSRVAKIARDAGVIGSDEIATLHGNVGGSGRIGVKLQVSPRVLCEQKFNIRVRETLASAFLQIFLQYDKFVISPILDENGQWTFQTETQDNFDKTSFLSDQPEAHLSFLLSFLDTQMFASFIDNAIESHQQHDQDSYQRLFDDRIDQSKIPLDPQSPTTLGPPPGQSTLRTVSVSSNLIASPYFETWVKDSETSVEKRLSQVDRVSCLPHPVHQPLDVDSSGIPIMNMPGTFPVIRGNLLDTEGFEAKKRHLRRRNDSRTAFRRQASVRGSKWKKIQEARSQLLRQPSMSEYSPEVIAQTNWRFVKKLLDDVKHKTKKILIGKMGREAIELGHGELSDSVSNLEEKTWIASLCDLLERAWSHGLLTIHKKGKSALWWHLRQYQEDEEQRRIKKNMLYRYSGSTPSIVAKETSNELSPSSNSFDETTSYYSLPRSFERKRSNLSSPRKSMDSRQASTNSPNHSSHDQIPQLFCSVLSSMRRVQSMKEIQTEVGRSRAWIRLALEQKQLHPYLSELLRNHRLLDRMYKKYALLQCEDEREQFLYHLLSLKAADFNCFTNSFPKTTIEYKVWIVPGRQFAGSSQTSANVYMCIRGELCKTQRISVPKGCLEFSFKHQNLGVMTTMTIGHDNAGILPKWLLDYVIVQNQVTGQTYCFPCRRWLGKGVDDNSLERLLLMEVVPMNENVARFTSDLAQQTANSYATIPELQEKVGQAVNNIIKYYHKPEHRLDMSPPPAALTKLIFNLVLALKHVFSHGLKPAGLFKRRLFSLDVISASVQSYRDNMTCIDDAIRSSSFSSSPSINVATGGDWFLGSRRSSAVGVGQMRRSHDPFDSRVDANDVIKTDNCLERERVAFARLCDLYQQITDPGSAQKLGKDDIFFLLVCIGIKERSIALWLPKFSDVAIKDNSLYEDSAFLCETSAVVFLCQVLNMLVEFDVPLDNSLLRGYENLMKI